MNVNQLLIQAFGPLISSFWWLIPLFIIVVILKTPFIKGVIGEFQVNLVAKLFLDKHIYTLFKNMTFPNRTGGCGRFGLNRPGNGVPRRTDRQGQRQ